MAGFEELGLSDTLLARAREQGFDTPAPLQRSIIPALRRGSNAIIRASSGSGVTSAYGLALADRFADGGSTRALVIVPTVDRAERVARTIAQFTYESNARVAAMSSAWPDAAAATIVVASAEKLRTALADSGIKLDAVEAVVVENTAATIRLAGLPALEQIFSSLPREGQRIFISSEMTDEVRKLAEAHARKALTFPPRPAIEETHATAAAPTRALRYVVAGGDKKTDAIARLRSPQAGPITVVGRSAAATSRAQRELSARGFDVISASYDGFDASEIRGALFAFDPPFTAEQLLEDFSDDVIVLCERHELPHLKAVAAEANLKLESAALPSYEADSLNAFRNEIRRAAHEEDLESQMLVLEPLFNELSPEEVAAAAAALLRSRRPVQPPKPAGARGDLQTWVRLFFSIGERDGVRAGDIVGAITGESGVKGAEVGRVDIRDTFSVVEVASDAADRIIRAMNGTTMKGRALRVDYDRKTSAGGGGGRSSGGGGRPAGRPREGGPREGGPHGGPRGGGARGGGPRGGRSPAPRDR